MVAVPAAAATPTAGTSQPRAQKKSSNPSPSPRRRDPLSSARLPLSPFEKDNAAVPRRPRGKEITSRYLASSSPSSAAKRGSFSSASASSSSKGASFTSSSSSCSASTASSSSSSTATSSPRCFRSPLPVRRPSTPLPLPQTCMPTRSKSVDRTRSTDNATRCAAHNPAELSSATARALRTTTRSLSVSFQGESFSYQTSKVRPLSPSHNRKPTPERRVPAAPAAVPARSNLKLESSRTFDNHHRWPAARTDQFNPLTRSLNCSFGEKGSVLAAIRSPRDSMAHNEGARRVSFDGGDLSLSFDTDSVSSGGNSGSHECGTIPSRGRTAPHGIDVPARFLQEKGSRFRRLTEPGTPQPSPGLGSVASSKLVPAKKLVMNGLLPLGASSPRHGSPRPSSPGKPTATSPRGTSGVPQVPNSLIISSSSTVSLPGNVASHFNFAADIKRGKTGDRRIQEAHQLRLLYNRYLQWRWVNAQANDIFIVQKLTAEKCLHNAWITTTKMHESTTIRKIKLQTDRQHLKLNSILKGQINYLQEWPLINQDHSSALSGALEALKASTIALPIVNGAKADFQDVRNAIGSAVDIMQAIGTSICAVLSKVEGRNSMVSELAELAKEEQALMDQCRDLLSTVALMHVKQCSLLGHITQLCRPSLIQL